MDDMLVMDVTPLSLGIETIGSTMSVVVKRNTPIPCKKQHIFTTTVDDQPSIDVCIYEGERPSTKDNNMLGEFELSGIQVARRGEPQIEVSFSIDANGILKVQAEDRNTGTRNNVTIKNEDRLSATDVERMIAEAAKFASEDREVSKAKDASGELEAFVYDIQQALTNEKIVSALSAEEKTAVEEQITEVSTWLDSEDSTAERDDFRRKLRDLESVCVPLTKAMRASA